MIGRRAIPGAGALAAASYSLYLSHKAVYHWVGTLPITADLKPFMFPIAILAALAVGAVLYRLVERPFLDLRDRLSQPTAGSLSAVAVIDAA